MSEVQIEPVNSLSIFLGWKPNKHTKSSRIKTTNSTLMWKLLLYILSIIFTLFVLTASLIRLVVIPFTFRLTLVYWLLHRKYPKQSKQRPTAMLSAEIQYWIFGRILTIKLTVLTITGVIFSSFWKKSSEDNICACSTNTQKRFDPEISFYSRIPATLEESPCSRI